MILLKFAFICRMFYSLVNSCKYDIRGFSKKVISSVQMQAFLNFYQGN